MFNHFSLHERVRASASKVLVTSYVVKVTSYVDLVMGQF